MTEEEIVMRGEVAAFYLNDKTLAGFIEEMKGDLLTCIANTPPDAKAAREELYHQHRGLVALLDHMRAYADAAEQINAKNEAQATQAPDED